MATNIHPLACVDGRAELGDGVEIGPFAVVEADVRLGPGCRVGPHAVIFNGARLGRDNLIHAGAYLGAESQARAYHGEPSTLEIGDRNVIREAVTLNRATGEGEVTRLGDDNLIMAYAHVAHNCLIGDHVTLANGATLAGRVVIEDCATLGGLSAVHQFCRIGRHAYVGGETKVTQDVLPFIWADGHPARPYGLNVIGLRRGGFSEETILDIKRAYKIIYHSSLLLREALDRLREEYPGLAWAQAMVDFIAASERGIIRPRRAWRPR